MVFTFMKIVCVCVCTTPARLFFFSTWKCQVLYPEKSKLQQESTTQHSSQPLTLADFQPVLPGLPPPPIAMGSLTRSCWCHTGLVGRGRVSYSKDWTHSPPPLDYGEGGEGWFSPSPPPSRTPLPPNQESFDLPATC